MREEGKDFFLFGVYQSSAQKLVIIGDFAISVVLLTALIAMDV